ncbi:hypothetical protein [Actinokineospora spheciospongiae]|uniref:hypothetical protein n=1 Tax=Actinokineospora spheciospongiae TaxID=909613 RepID=UPI00068D1DE8|nr:hypothetical protein [Actinokineospora spheciospongiae]
MGTGLPDAGAAVRFGDRDTGQLTGGQPRQPPSAGPVGAVAGDEPAVAQAGGVAQVQVPVAAHELGQQLPQRRLITESAVGDQRAPHSQQPMAALRAGEQVGAEGMGFQGVIECRGQLDQPQLGALVTVVSNSRADGREALVPPTSPQYALPRTRLPVVFFRLLGSLQIRLRSTYLANSCSAN